MTWFAVVWEDSGKLVSVGSVLADPMPQGYEVVELGPDRPEGTWNEESRAFDPPEE